MTLDANTKNLSIYGDEHKRECEKNAKDFYRRELLKQHVHKLCTELPINQMKPLNIFKKAMNEFENIAITKKFKSQMLCHIRNVKFQRSKVQRGDFEMSPSQSIPTEVVRNSKR